MTKELTAYKIRYAKAVKRETEIKIINSAFLNLSADEFHDFVGFVLYCENEVARVGKELNSK